jgi:hypothetical protein
VPARRGKHERRVACAVGAVRREAAAPAVLQQGLEHLEVACGAGGVGRDGVGWGRPGDGPPSMGSMRPASDLPALARPAESVAQWPGAPFSAATCAGVLPEAWRRASGSAARASRRAAAAGMS